MTMLGIFWSLMPMELRKGFVERMIPRLDNRKSEGSQDANTLESMVWFLTGGVCKES